MADLTMMLLGPKTSGKTMFMTVFYRERNPLTADKPERLDGNWTLWLSNDDMPQFSRANYSINDPDTEEFAEATATYYKWDFTARVDGGIPQIDAFSFKYIDIPGEWTVDADESNYSAKGIPQEYYTYMKDSQILFGVLDGEDILAFLQDPMKATELDRKYNLILLQIGLAQVKHLIITKFEIFEGKYDWSQVLAGLKKWDKLADFIARNKKSGIKGNDVRIIPISALNGKVRNVGYHENQKEKNGSLKPSNINVPLALALELAIKLKYDDLNKKNRRLLLTVVKFVTSTLYKQFEESPRSVMNTLYGILDRTTRGLWRLIGAISLLATASIVVGYSIQALLLVLGGGIFVLIALLLVIRALLLRYNESQVENSKNVRSRRQALALISANLMKEINEFDDNFNGNLLT